MNEQNLAHVVSQVTEMVKSRERFAAYIKEADKRAEALGTERSQEIVAKHLLDLTMYSIATCIAQSNAADPEEASKAASFIMSRVFMLGYIAGQASLNIPEDIAEDLKSG